jgi:ribosome-binding ATPase YchF (GTP1/OBG family)
LSPARFHGQVSMKDAKDAGVYRLEGETNVVKDGDIMHIL